MEKKDHDIALDHSNLDDVEIQDGWMAKEDLSLIAVDQDISIQISFCLQK
jgi:hypothetical protein